MKNGNGTMKKDKIILLPLDGSKGSLNAFLPAKGLAKLLGMTVKILHISDETLSNEDLIQKLQLKHSFLNSCVIEHRSGVVTETILEVSQEASYIVMTTHGQTMNLKKLIGNTAHSVIEGSIIPVILIRPEIEVIFENEHWKPRKVLIPLNGTPGASQALEPVIKILAEIQSEIDLLHISIYKCGQALPNEPGSYPVPYYMDSPQYEWPNWANEFIKRFYPILNHHNIKLHLHNAKGNPAEEIINYSKQNKNDLIAMAWHGEMSGKHGNILSRVVVEAHCPILLIKIKN